MRFLPLLLVGLGLNSAALANPTERQEQAGPLAQWSLNLAGRLQPNNEPESVHFFPKPYVAYSRMNADRSQQSLFLVGGLFNRVSHHQRLNENWDASGSLQAVTYIGGDRPRIDGDDFLNQFDFRSNDLSGELGLHYRFQALEFPLRASLVARSQVSWSFQRKNPEGRNPPKFHGQLGPLLRVSRAQALRSRIHDRGFFPQAYASYQHRLGWDLESLVNRRQLGGKTWFEFGGGFQHLWALNSDDRVLFEGSGYWIARGDRLNSVPGRQFQGDAYSKFFSEIRADRFLEAGFSSLNRLSLRGDVWIQRSLQFFHFREVGLFDLRKRSGLNASLELLGESWNRFDWSFYYGASYGLRKDPLLTHELGFRTSYRL